MCVEPLGPLRAWVWRDRTRRVTTLLRFGDVEEDGGRDLVRAAELTPDPVLRRLYLVHARDEFRHARLFRQRGALLHAEKTGSASGRFPGTGWLTPGERGLDDVDVGAQGDAPLLAFLHLSESAAARNFSHYRDLLDHDPLTRDVFEAVLHDEEFHMRYTGAQLARIEPSKARLLLWRARAGRLWNALVRMMTGVAGLISGVLLTIQYFVILPPFAWLARRSARREHAGWHRLRPEDSRSLDRQY